MAAVASSQKEPPSCEELQQLLVQRDGELESAKAEMRHLEDIVAQQSQMLDSLKKQVIENSRYRESDLLATNNKISDQEARLLRHTISQLQKSESDLKKEVNVACEMLESERALTRTQAFEIEKRKQQCLELTDVVEQLRADIQIAERRREMRDWSDRETAVRAQCAFEHSEDIKKVTAMEIKLASMRDREVTLCEELNEVKGALECALSQQEGHLKRIDDDSKSIAALNAEVSALRLQLELISTKPQPPSKRDETSEDTLVLQVKALAEEIGKNKGCSSIDTKMAELQRMVGSLSTAKGFLEAQIGELREAESNLKNNLEASRSQAMALRAELEKLQATLSENEANAELTRNYLSNELCKVKQQKAQLRCELLELKRKHARENFEGHSGDSVCSPATSASAAHVITSPSASTEGHPSEGDHHVKSTSATHHSEVQCDLVEVPTDASMLTEESTSDTRLCDDCAGLKDEITRLERALSDALEQIRADKAKADQLSKCLQEELAVQKAVNKRLEGDLQSRDEKVQELGRAVRILDEQCEKIMKLKKEADAGRAKACEKLASVNEELLDARREADRFAQVNIDSKVVKQERDRLLEQVKFLQEEMRTTHVDHRAEIASLAQRVAETKHKEAATENERIAARLEQVQSEKRQMEASMRSLERQLQQCKVEIEQHSKENAELRSSKSGAAEENLKLRAALAEAISKIEKHKDEAIALQETNATLKEDLKKAVDERADALTRSEFLQESLSERERLVVYLQSQVPMSKAGKLSKAGSRSTLISADVSVVEETTSDFDNQENIPAEPLQSSAQKSGVKSERDVTSLETSLPLIKKRAGYVNSPGAADAEPLYAKIQQNRSLPAQSSTPTGRLGAMKHDIPHRWKSHLVLKQEKCVVCLEGLPKVRLAFKCSACSVLVHRRCVSSVLNTCGLPSQYADYYIDAQPVVSGYMTGWVKLWRSDDRSGSKWRHAFAYMDERRLCFSDSEGLAASAQGVSPFFTIDLAKDQWRIHMQAVPDVGVKGSVSTESYALLIELRLATGSLFMLAPTPQAKQRWVLALQSATNRRKFVQRRPSSLQSGNSMILGLDAPLNLSVNCAQVLDEWLLIGCQEGLFVTPLTCPRVPCVIAGLTAVFHMELLAELDMLVAISGPQRQLHAIHVSQLREACKSEQPSVRATAIASLAACHLLTVHRDAERNARFLCVADPDQIHVLQYTQRTGMFTLFKSIATCEPAMCLQSVGEGLVFGADQFYFVHSADFAPRPLLVPGCAPDWPLAAVAVSNRELLLAYHNYGVFADTKGNRTRAENVDWTRAPLEFVYTSRCLYVVHYETLEVLRLADYCGPTSRTLLDERDVFRVQNAHYLGFGRNSREVLFALSGKDRTEIHSFVSQTEKKSSGSTLKRKPSASSGLSQKAECDKRYKS